MWTKVDATVKPFDESKYPQWLFKKKEDPLIKFLLEGDGEQEMLRKKEKQDSDFDLVLAEHRARKVEKDLGLDIKRAGVNIYKAGTPFMVEMNLHNAS